ncbi:ead/Ea22-like family protein [Salmonella enterica]|nr:ead/Ea22-like family protein [Salmonella enterica]ELK9346893.1 ead/Ea22-like family protein [Salmonella enterica]ELK9374026.1 ead/Ea22-like family protein [Salmonella enterica]ELK9790695.1 ead/Ea22-like family protein [Salmonella enterica]
MTIDKQALREAAEKADSGEWSYEEFNRLDLPGGAHIRINGRAAVYCLNKATGGIEQSRAMLAHIAAFSPKVALALLDENIQLQREKDVTVAMALALRDDMRQARDQLVAAGKRNAEQREYYEGVIADGSKRIAELEAREIKPVKGEVLVTVSGFTGCGKSAIAGEIEIAMKAIGVPVTWSNGDAEKRMTGADWLTAIEMYKPSVRIVEVNVPRAAGIKVKGE